MLNLFNSLVDRLTKKAQSEINVDLELELCKMKSDLAYARYKLKKEMYDLLFDHHEQLAMLRGLTAEEASNSALWHLEPEADEIEAEYDTWQYWDYECSRMY